MGFDWQLVDRVIGALSIEPGTRVLDPFCGAGTTLVQCKKRGIQAVGLDVNPVCILATQVKTTWSLDPVSLRRALSEILRAAGGLDTDPSVERSTALAYLRDSGMIERGWLSAHKARKVLALRAAIRQTTSSTPYRNFFHLALISAVVSKIADIKFGPEVYCLATPKRSPVTRSFADVADLMIRDLAHVKGLADGLTTAKVFLGDSRRIEGLECAPQSSVDYVITSPPYPNEHDYTRSTRLELVFLDHVNDLAGLRRIKRQMIRCTTKGVYRDDNEAQASARYAPVDHVARALDDAATDKSDGFSRLYGRMVREYFGGMSHHFGAIKRALKPGGRCAYVVRDSQSFHGVYIDTPTILATIASHGHGFAIDGMQEWKRIKGTTGTRMLSEKIIMLRKPR